MSKIINFTFERLYLSTKNRLNDLHKDSAASAFMVSKVLIMLRLSAYRVLLMDAVSVVFLSPR